MDGVRIGYVPSYLSEFVNRAMNLSGAQGVKVTVVHIGARSGPSHYRLLCRLAAQWPEGETPFSGDAFEPLVADGFLRLSRPLH